MIDLIVLAVTLLLIGAVMFFIPVMKGPDGFFGIPVSDEFYHSPTARRCLGLYRLITALLVCGSMALLLLGPRAGLPPLGAVLVAMLVASLGPLVPLVIFWHQVKPYEARAELAAEADQKVGDIIEEHPTDKWRYVNPSVEAVLLAALIALIGLALSRYPNLPDRIPVHWNAAGQADGWQSKNPFPLASLLLMLAFFHVMFLTLLTGMAQVPIRLPAQRTYEFRAVREQYMRMWAHCLNGLRLLLVIIFGAIIWASLFGIEKQARGGAPPGMILIWVCTAALFIALGCLISKSLRLRRQMREIGGPGLLERNAPTEGWIGGVIYFNRNDPALWVEKRIGIGWTLNFAHPTAWVMIVLALAVPLGITAVVFLA
ncbi:MAG: DUF5808 domain-containing protein, partial [Armatimonadota bacterium]